MVKARKGDAAETPLSSGDIRRLAGPVADHTVMGILEIGASIADLEVAMSYARGEGSEVDRAGHPLSGKAAQIADILAKDELYLANNER
jgi:hypothetical protein